jgi:hypothetical protein
MGILKSAIITNGVPNNKLLGSPNDTNVWLAIVLVTMFVVGCICLALATSFPNFQIFWITISFGVFVTLAITAGSYYLVVATKQDDAQKQSKNIVPGYCPDYWTKGFDAKGNVVCKNGFRGRMPDGREVAYTFANLDKPIPASITLNDIGKFNNTSKCNSFGNPIKFPAPWLEMHAKCDTVTY